MSRQSHATHRRDRIAAGLPFVEALARRLAASMPHSIDLGDLVQDGMIGLIDAAHRFDESRGIKFETFAERRVRGAMIRRPAARRLAARAPACSPGARSGSGVAAASAGSRTVDRRPGRALGFGRSSLGTDHRPHQDDRVDLAIGDR